MCIRVDVCNVVKYLFPFPPKVKKAVEARIYSLERIYELKLKIFQERFFNNLILCFKITKPLREHHCQTKKKTSRQENGMFRTIKDFKNKKP